MVTHSDLPDHNFDRPPRWMIVAFVIHIPLALTGAWMFDGRAGVITLAAVMAATFTFTAFADRMGIAAARRAARHHYDGDEPPQFSLTPYIAVALTLAAIGVVVAIIADEPAPRTDPQAFLDRQHPYDLTWGGQATDAELLSIGAMICDLRRSGLTPDQTFDTMHPFNLPPGPVRDLGLARIADAETFLCGGDL